MKPQVSIIIPVHNKWELTRDCLRSLAEHRPAENCEVIVVDNASRDETAAQAQPLGRSLFGTGFRRLRLDSNRNFGPACNFGAARASGDLLFFLNNDTLLTSGWLPPLLRAMETPGTAGVGPLLAYADDTVQHMGIAIDPAGNTMGHLHAHLPVSHPLARKRRAFPAITAAALLVPKTSFLAGGGFFEAYVNGFEDVDLGFRLTADGAVLRVEPDSLVYHLESQTPRRHDSDIHNSALLLARWNLSAYSNLEKLARDDGYELRVEPTLKFLLTPAKSRLPGLLRRLRGPGGTDSLRMWELLQEEPYWEDGYVFLAQFLEQAGAEEQALGVLYHGLLLNPSLALHEHLLRVTRLVGQHTDMTREINEIEMSLRAERAIILKRVRYEADLAARLDTLRSRGDTELAALCAEAGQRAAELRRIWTEQA